MFKHANYTVRLPVREPKSSLRPSWNTTVGNSEDHWARKAAAQLPQAAVVDVYKEVLHED
jgi:D-tyrosyl-tRNA(Tyr) deacylase